MEKTVKQRLIDFINYKKISVRAFERQVGVSNGYIKSLRKSPTADKVLSIIRNFPELNQNWLLTGEGDMIQPTSGQSAIIGGDGTAVAGNANQVNATSTLDKALDEIAAQRRLTEKAQEQIDRLITLLEKQHQ